MAAHLPVRRPGGRRGKAATAFVAALLLSGGLTVGASAGASASGDATSGDWSAGDGAGIGETRWYGAAAKGSGTSGGGSAGAKLSARLKALAQTDTQDLATSKQSARLGLPAKGPGSLLRAPDGSLLIYVRVADTGRETLQAMERAGARLMHADAHHGVVTALIAPSGLAGLVGALGVLSVREALSPMVGGSGFNGRAVQGSSVTTGSGGSVSAAACAPIVSEGDAQLRADLARSELGADGTGVKVGIISDSFDVSTSASTNAAGDVAAGDLPGPGNPCGRLAPISILSDSGVGGIDEGRAMAQIVHDVAPGASLLFAPAPLGIFEFAGQVRALAAAGSNVIVDDISYLDEPFFQDGPVSVAIDEVAAAGVSYFTASGNGNVVVDGRDVGSFESPSLRPTTCPVFDPGFGVPTLCHDFDPGSGSDPGWDLAVAPGGGLLLDFQWNESWYGVSNDIDVYVLDSATNEILGGSVDDNLVSQEPFEAAFYLNDLPTARNVKIVVSRYSGPGLPRLKGVMVLSDGITGVQYSQSQGGDIVGPTITGHSGAAGAGSVAAVPYNDSTVTEPFSSRGPMTVFRGPVIGAIPAQALGGPITREKPDFAATDNVRTSFFADNTSGAYRFLGTSAAAPHAAAVAALLLERNPGAIPSRVMSALGSTARPVPNGGGADAVGDGLIDALAAVTALDATAIGYRLVASDGGIFAYGDAKFYGSTGGMSLARPIVGMAPTPSGNGYWLVASDGGIFAYGDAKFYGSTGGMSLARPIVGMAPTPSGNGYWLVASDGGIFAYGDAKFYGSTGGMSLARPIVGMLASMSGKGYRLVASDGGIFAYGDAKFYGSTGGMSLARPIVSMAS